MRKTKILILTSIIIVGCILFALVDINPVKAAETEDIVTLTFSGTEALGNVEMPPQHCTAYNPETALYWVFYFKYSAGDYRTFYTSSPNGTAGSWAAGTEYGMDTGRGLDAFDFCIDGNEIFVVYDKSSVQGDSVMYRHGTLYSNGSIVWSSAWDDTAKDGHDVCIALNSNGYPWISYESTDTNFHVMRSSTRTSWNTQTDWTLDTAGAGSYSEGQIIGLSSTNMYCFVDYDDLALYGYLYTGSWGSKETVASNVYEMQYSAVRLSNDDIFVGYQDSTLDIIVKKRTYTNSSWHSPKVIDTTHTYDEAAPTLTVTGQDTVYAFYSEYISASQHNIKYVKWTAVAGWSSATQIVTNTRFFRHYGIDSDYIHSTGGKKISVIWIRIVDASTWAVSWAGDPAVPDGEEEPPTTLTATVTSTPPPSVDFTVDGSSYTTSQELTLNLSQTYEFIASEQEVTVGTVSYEFSYWLINATTYHSITIQVSMGGNTTLVIYYIEQAETPDIPPIYDPTAINATWYMRSDTHTIKDILGYKLHDYQSYTAISESRYSSTETVAVSYGVRLWVLDCSGNKEELSNGNPVAIVTRNDNGSGILSGTWVCPEYSNIIDAVQVNVYQRFGSGSWSLRRIFITTEPLLIRFPESTWTFYYYVTQVKLSTNSTFHHGSFSFNSRVNLQYYRISVFEKMTYHLQKFQLLSFLVTPWTYYLGTMFYGILLFFFAVTTYLRYHSIRAVLAVFWVFGGTGGFLSALMPAMGLQISWLILALTLAVTIFLLIYGRRS